MNEKHEKLIKEAKEALERLVEFEMDKLGMTNEDYEMRKAIDAQKIQE